VVTGTNTLQAGALRCTVAGADVRDLRIGARRVLTRLYIAVRDESWNTVPFSCEQKILEKGADSFKVESSCLVDHPPINAEWTVTVTGSAAGEFSYAMRGQALSSFRFAKLGLNLHHPVPESLGARYVARRGDMVAIGKIPTLVEPQFVVDGKLTGMFMPYAELVLQSAGDDELVFRFSGDEFEMQDHRNWTDYNLKSYGTPLEVPLPLSAGPGQVFEQSVVVDVRRARGGHDGPRISVLEPAPRIDVDRTHVAQLPRIGSEFPDEGIGLDPGDAALIEALPLHYVRVNLDLTCDEGLGPAAEKARQVNAWRRRLELVLVVSPGRPREVEVTRLGHWLEEVRPQLERVVVLEGPRGYYIGRTTTPGEKVRAYREGIESRCGPSAFVSATEQFFAELNRWWPELAGVDGVGYTICPQVHAADDASLMENSWGQADTVATARARSGGRAVNITSVAMIGKFGPYPAGAPALPRRSACGDERQRDLFGAAWTLSSLRQLVDAEAASVTYFELAGGRGLVGAPGGATRTGRVPFPVYLLLETVLSWEGGNLVRVGTVQGGELVGLGAEWPGRSDLLVANLGQIRERVNISGLCGKPTEVSELELDPLRGAYWALSPDATPRPGTATAVLDIGPYGIARVRTAR
jgi:D-apionolactonase